MEHVRERTHNFAGESYEQQSDLGRQRHAVGDDRGSISGGAGRRLDGIASLFPAPASHCRSRRFAISPTATFLINGKSVAFEQLRKVLQADSTLQLIVAYYVADQQLSRIVVTSQVRQ
jgi:hypothetical protein